MNNRNLEILNILKNEYKNTKCALIYSSAWQLLLATILSAQCTDARVNIVTSKLFKIYPDINDYTNIKKDELEKLIYSTGFFKQKANNIIETANIIVNKYKGIVPNSMAELIKLKGVARKTANVLLSEYYHKSEGIAVDTHVKRLSLRLGLSSNTIPNNIEKDLMSAFNRNEWLNITRLLIAHGRKVCNSRKPKCNDCKLKHLCKYYSQLEDNIKIKQLNT